MQAEEYSRWAYKGCCLRAILSMRQVAGFVLSGQDSENVECGNGGVRDDPGWPHRGASCPSSRHSAQ